MATTRLMPLHTGKGRKAGRAIRDIIGYAANPQKTQQGELVTGYACDPNTADGEFLLAKREYLAQTGRIRGKDDVIAYHLRQSFAPGEITPEDANRIGRELALRFTHGQHAFIVATHTDRHHIHNHIIFHSVNLDCNRKFRNFWGLHQGYTTAQRYAVRRKRPVYRGKSKTARQKLQQVAGRSGKAFPA